MKIAWTVMDVSACAVVVGAAVLIWCFWAGVHCLAAVVVF